MSQDEWLPTGAASKELGCSPTLLKRSRDDYPHGSQILVSGKHYRYLPASNAAILWNVPLIRDLFHERGMRRRRAERALEREMKLRKIQAGQE